MNEPKRKLAAIMFTDIAGYTGISANDEEGAFALIEKQRKTLKPIVSEFSGEWLKEIGDGLLLCFPSTKDAVNCAIKIQHAVKEIDGLNLRIGIHQGDILQKGGDVFGDDINVASRIEPFSAVGGIAISNKVLSDISSSPEYETKFVSQPTLKGVSQQIKIYCIISHGLPETEITEVTSRLEKDVKKLWFNQKFIFVAIGLLFISVVVIFFYFPKEDKVPSIAILLMENHGNSDDNFWVRGITEDLIIKMAGAGLIRVAPMQEILHIDSDQKLINIAKELRVKHLLTSSLFKKGDSFDLRCQLIEANSGISLYANKWSEPIENSTKIVGNISQNILNILGVSNKRPIKAISGNHEAQKFYYLARDKFYTRKNEEDILEARILVSKAVEGDNNFILARSLLASTYDALHDTLKANTLYRQNYEIAKILNDTIGLTTTLLDIALISPFDKAKDYYQRAISYSKHINNYNLLATTFYQLGRNYYINGLKDEALEYYLISLEYYELIEKKPIGPLKAAGDIYREKGELDKAQKYYRLSLDNAKIKNNHGAIAYNKMQIAAIMIRKHNYNDSNKLLLEAFEFSKNVKDFNMCGHTLGYLINNYIELGDEQKYMHYANEYIALVENNNVEHMKSHCYGHASEAYKANGDKYNYEKYLALMEKYSTRK